ncbi:MAG: substrate-binding domain-containing protein [Rubrivivax sp.]
MPATLDDVARQARVSKSTASRALSVPGRVNATTAARVRQAAAALNYVSHGVARALTTRRTRTIGAVIPTLENAIYATSAHAMEQRLQKAGYMLLVACHEFDLDLETSAVEALVSRGVDGIALVGLEHRKKTMALLERAHVPYVLTWNLERGRQPCVGFDNREAGFLVTDYLVRLGHRNFGVIAGITAGNDRAASRLAGIRDALAKAGIKLNDHQVVEKAYSLEGGQDGLSTLLGKPPKRTAIVCGNDILAIGAIHEARGRRIEIPAELSITGFDDMPLAAMSVPPLTTVHFPMAEVGINAAMHLLNALGESDEVPERELPVRLVVRGSTDRPRR